MNDAVQQSVSREGLRAESPDSVNVRLSNPDIDRLIQWLRNASVTEFDFTIEGTQQVCKPKYLLTKHRDFIILLLREARR